MIGDDRMEPVDQSLRSIREASNVDDCVVLPKVVKDKNITFHSTPSHDHPCTFVNQNSSETMFSKANETLCGSSIIPTMVMSGSHSYTSHLESDISHGDHATLSSSTQNNISIRDEEDAGGKRETILSPQAVTLASHPPMIINNTFSKIFE